LSRRCAGNENSCNIAADLFGQHPGVLTRFCCERAKTFRRSTSRFGRPSVPPEKNTRPPRRTPTITVRNLRRNCRTSPLPDSPPKEKPRHDGRGARITGGRSQWSAVPGEQESLHGSLPLRGMCPPRPNLSKHALFVSVGGPDLCFGQFAEFGVFDCSRSPKRCAEAGLARTASRRNEWHWHPNWHRTGEYER
jgi:hypothetical protein